MAVTVGIDLASQSAGTAICAIHWGAEPRVEKLMCGVISLDEPTPLDDKLVLGVMSANHGAVPDGVTKVAIDAPFGWPVAFADAVSGRGPWIGADTGVAEDLVRRRTDSWIRDNTPERKVPLSVSADRIAYPAMRLAHLFDRYRENHDVEVDRTGRTGRLCEAYPDPALRALGLWPEDEPPRASYKGPDNAERRRAIVEQLGTQAPWLSVSEAFKDACVQTDDALDALVCALIARASERGLVHPIPGKDEQYAAREGWIHLPIDGVLEALR